MERKIIYLPEAQIYFLDLINILFEKGYFGFMEYAEAYVLKIRHFIEENIETYPSKITPDSLKQYGENYILYKANSRTTWYIFYSREEEFYLIRFIANNHSRFITGFNL